MSRQGSYSGFLENLHTAGGERAIAIEVAASYVQRPVYLSASVMPLSTTPTKPEQNGYSRVLVYVGIVNDTRSTQLDSNNGNLVESIGLTRMIASRLVRVGESIEINFPVIQADALQSQPNETLGAMIIIPTSVDPDAIAPNAAFNALATLSFFGAPANLEQVKQWRVV